MASAPRRAQGPGTPGEDAGLLFVSMAPGAVLDDGPAEAAPADAPAFAVDPTADTGPHRALPGGGEGLPLGLRRVAAREVEALVDGSVLVEVPGGSYFPRLPDPGDRSTLKQVPVRAFLIGKTPVTWGQYRRYCAATGRAAPAPEHPVTDAHPVHGVTWDDARAYCAWAGLRLPTEAEREYAASGEEQRRFPWGDEPPTAERCNFAGAGLGATTPVGARPAGASPFGVLDLAGNVLEWVDDGRPAASTRPLRGGAFRHDAALCEVRRRHLLPAVAREGFVGFRVARDAPGAAGPAAPAPVAAAAGVPAPGPGAAAPRATGRTARPSDRIEVRSSGEHPGLADEARAVAAGLAEGLVGCLPPEAGGASRKGAEVRLTFTPPGGTRGVPLSLIVVDPVNGVAVVEQRVTLDRATLQGPPTGWLNLLRAANAATAAGLGLACAPGADRLRWRRPLVLQRAEGQPPSTPARVREAAQRLIDGWKAFVEPVKRALHGEPWPAALRACLPDGRPPAPPARALDDLGRRVPEAWTRVKQQEGLAVWPGIPREAAPVVLVPGDEVTATRLLRPWAGTRQDAAALRAGEPCPRVDALLEQLAARNTLGPAALAWEAGRGVVARLALGATPTGEDLERAAAVLLEAGDGLEGRGW